MFDNLDPTWVAGLITALGGYVFHKIWGRATDKQKQIATAVMGESRSVVRSLVLTAPPGTTPAQIVIWAKGAIAIQLAKKGLKLEDNPVLRALADEVIADAVTFFIETHPDPKSQAAPIMAKLPA